MKRDIFWVVAGVLLVVLLVAGFSGQINSIYNNAFKSGENKSVASSSKSSSSALFSLSNNNESQTLSAGSNSSSGASNASASNSQNENDVDATTISKETLAENNNEDSCYMAYKGIVYDMSDYINNHPGGKDIISGCGKDIAYLENAHRGPKPSSAQFQNILKGREFGTLK